MADYEPIAGDDGAGTGPPESAPPQTAAEKRLARELAKLQRERERHVAKAAKEAERAAKKKQKELERAAREQERDEKKAAAEAERARKAAEREQAKLEREAEKERKAQERADRKAAAEAERARKAAAKAEREADAAARQAELERVMASATLEDAQAAGVGGGGDDIATMVAASQAAAAAPTTPRRGGGGGGRRRAAVATRSEAPVPADASKEAKERTKLLSRIRRFRQLFPHIDQSTRADAHTPLPVLRAIEAELRQQLNESGAEGAMMRFYHFGVVALEKGVDGQELLAPLVGATPNVKGFARMAMHPSVTQETMPALLQLMVEWNLGSIGPGARLALALGSALQRAHAVNTSGTTTVDELLDEEGSSDSDDDDEGGESAQESGDERV